MSMTLSYLHTSYIGLGDSDDSLTIVIISTIIAIVKYFWKYLSKVEVLQKS